MNFEIVRDGKVVYLISKSLLEKQFKSKSEQKRRLVKIKELHHNKLDIYDLMNIMDPLDDQVTLEECDKELTQIEFRLQEAWNFKKNINFHRFWDRPHCKCPKMDNDDSYPSGLYYRTHECPLHGMKVPRFKHVDDEVESNSIKNNLKCLDSLLKPEDSKSFSRIDVSTFLAITGSILLFIGGIIVLSINQDVLHKAIKSLIGA